MGWDSQVAVKDYLARISARIPLFETMQEQELNYIKVYRSGICMDPEKKLTYR